MKNLVLITSVIAIRDTPLSYTTTRSVFTQEQRFEQTKLTIQSIKKYIPDSVIVLVECSELLPEYKAYLEANCDHFINLFDNPSLRATTSCISKALGEGSMTIEALSYIEKLGLEYENFYKISGRYHLNENFIYENFNNDKAVVLEFCPQNFLTVFFKIPHRLVGDLKNFLIAHIEDMCRCIGYEVLFGGFIQQHNPEEVMLVKAIGVQGFVSVCGTPWFI